MNICVVSREVYPYVKAGIGVYVYHLCRLLRDKGHQVFLITDNYEGINTLEDFAGIEVRPVSAIALIHQEIFSNYNLFYSHNVYQVLKDLTQEVKLDVVEFSDYFGESYFTLLEKKRHGFLKETPIIIKCHTSMYECLKAAHIPTDGYEDVILQEDYCITHANNLSAISHALAEKVRTRLSIIKPIEVLLNPLGLTQSKRSQYIPQSLKTVLYVGKLQYIKGTDLLVQAAIENLKRGHQFKVRLIGQDIDGHQEELLALIPDEYRMAFEFVGFANRDVVLEAFSQAYVSIFPSRWEGLSNVCIEAVTQGCPLILSDAGGLKEMKNFGDFGIYFPSEDLKTLTDQLNDFLCNESLRNQYAENCFNQSTIFLNDSIYEKVIDFYESAHDSHYQVIQARQIEDVIYDNFVHSKQLNVELHQEVIRLTNELQNLYTNWQLLNQKHETLIWQYGQLKTQLEESQPLELQKNTDD